MNGKVLLMELFLILVFSFFYWIGFYKKLHFFYILLFGRKILVDDCSKRTFEDKF